MSNRRNFIKSLGKAAIATAIAPALLRTTTAWSAEKFTFTDQYTLPKLPYAFDALEPHIDKQTMEIHHGKHHQAYITNLNKALEEIKDKTLPPLEEMFQNISNYPAAVRNNGGGHYNHSLFWQLMTPNAPKAPTGAVAQAINQTFQSFENFKTQFTTAATGRFGSGWAWLIATGGKLQITSTPNQDNPLMDVAEVRGTPILGLDVWEHAYYLKYQNKRNDYIQNWWNVVNWTVVEENFNKIK